MQDTFKIWTITTYDEYLNQWPAIPGKFGKLTDYQKSLGYKDPKDFFDKQAFAAQTLANDRVGGIVEKVFKTEDLTPRVQEQLKKFTYQTIDFLRMNDSVINFDIRTNQISFNNNRQFTSGTNIERIEQLCGPMAWRSWTLANIERLYASWADCNNVPYLLDEMKFYDKNEVDIKLGEIDDQLQVQQKFIDEKLKEFNEFMVKYLSDFAKELPKDKDFINHVTQEVAKNPNLKGDKGEKGDPGSIENLATINGNHLDKGGDIQVQVPIITRTDQLVFDSSVKNRLQLATSFADKVNSKQDKLTLIKNPASGETNAVLDDKGNLRILDAQFSGAKLVKNYGIIDSSVSGIEDTDNTLPTTKYLNKFLSNKNENVLEDTGVDIILKPRFKGKWISINNIRLGTEEISIYDGRDRMIITSNSVIGIKGVGLPESATSKQYVDNKMQYLLENLLPNQKDKIKQLMVAFDNSFLPKEEENEKI